MASSQPGFPTGTLTFLFTDLEGSTRLWERHPNSMKTALARHDALLRISVENNEGLIVKTTGDGLHAVFSSASHAANAALQAQQDLDQEAWPKNIGVIRVRMGLHTGESHLREGDYYGTTVNRAARIMSAGHGGQVPLSGTTASLIQDSLPPDCSLMDLGQHTLKDLSRSGNIFQLCHPDLQAEFPPIKSLAAFGNNLPLQLTSFIGREAQMIRIHELLAETRLLTLAGPGGTGKTRLMLQAAAEM
ncbi:MAG: adenylate/guanylate cyclase domain-containing protein, partial [Anaerolineales bacterium]|nr:adenylate/guanylate cyclase domain-containing protein [Anaerolineales bacterium]